MRGIDATWRRLIGAGALLIGATSASAYPGGTPDFQTDVTPYCAACHSSRDAAALAGAGERAEKETAQRKHLAVILSGQKGYADLSEDDRRTLASQIRALDAASTIALEAPDKVAPGAVFDVRVKVTGGSGPVVGVALVDAAHRWYARPATAAGWTLAAPPRAQAAGGASAQEWLSARPEAMDRNLTYVNLPLESDAATEKWGSGEVVFQLRAPSRVGALPLAAAYFYGTEKSTILGYKTNPMGWKETRGGVGGGSGRVLFTPVKQIRVE
jgi:hypothetical protein